MSRARGFGKGVLHTATAPAVEAGAAFGDQIELVGYDLPDPTWRPGDILPLTLFWQRLAAVEEDYSVFVHLSTAGSRLDGGGTLATQTDSAKPLANSRSASQRPSVTNRPCRAKLRAFS